MPGTSARFAGGVSVAAAAVAVAGIVLSAGPAGAATPTPAPTAAASACDRAPWGLRVQGAPANFDAGDRGGDYLWHDGTGFHLRVTHRNDNRVVYSGEITSPTAMRIDPVKLEAGDVARLSADRRTLTFAFADYGHIDGVNFHTDCASHITLSNLKSGTSRLPADRVNLGHYRLHPANVPFSISRLDVR